MKRHQKRQAVPKSWPVPRKGTKFVIRKNSNGVPILVVLRDMLQLAQNRKEVKAAIHKKDLLICGKEVDDEKKSMELLDVLTIVPAKKSYRLTLSEKGKFTLVEIADKEANEKVAKVIGKKVLAGKKTQINLLDGRNYLSDIDCKVNDSVIVDLKKNEVKKVLPLKEKAEVLIFGGKHAGFTGKITKLIPEYKMAEVKTEEKTFNALIKQLMIIN